MGAQKVTRIPKAANKPPQLSPEQKLLEDLSAERDVAQRRMELVQRVVEQRDQLVDQVDAIRELTERLIAEGERKDAELEKRDARIVELERTLKMLAEADEKLG